MNQVLVLNQDFTPLTICSTERAFLLVYLEKAELIIAAEDRKLRTVDNSFPFPSVIKIKRYVHIPYKGVVLTRQNIFRRDSFSCQYCGNIKDLTLDHLVPRSKGGKSSWTNLVTACKHCNARKGDYAPEDVGLKLLKRPSKPSYVMFLKTSLNGSTRKEWLPYLEPKAF